MTSATLATGTDHGFDFFQSRLGVTQASTLRVGSPFNYQEQCRLILVRGMPDPSQDAAGFERLSAAMIERYVQRMDGHAFALFTSYDLLRRVAARLQSGLRQHQLALYSQADGTPRQQLLEQFKQNRRGDESDQFTFLCAGVRVRYLVRG